MKHLNTWNIRLQHVRGDTLAGGDHHVRHAEELDDRPDGQIGANRRRSEEHHGLGRQELLSLGALRREEPRGGREVQHGHDAFIISSRKRRL